MPRIVAAWLLFHAVCSSVPRMWRFSISSSEIGSNAVVVKPVPAGGTAVGNPARIVMPAVSKPKETKSEGFCAYGITPNARFAGLAMASKQR